MTGVVSVRSQRPISSSRGVRPSRASTSNKAASASRTAASVCARILPGKVCDSSFSNPAVSMTRKFRPSRFASPSRRSRVTPGWSSTSARRLPTSRLKSVDLPTLGRPTIATVGRDMIAIYPRPGRGPILSEGRQPAVVVINVERRVGDDRRHADARIQLSLTLERTGDRIDVDDCTVGADDDQAIASQDRARIIDFAALRFGLPELRELVDPADVAICAGYADQLGVVGHDEDPVAGNPRGRNTRDVELPDALTRVELHRDHAPPLANGKDLAVVDDRVGINVGKRGHGRADAGTLESVLPDHSAVLVAISIELTRGETCNDGPLTGGGRGRSENASHFERCRLRPIGRTVGLLERVNLIVLAHHVYGAIGHGGSAAQGSAGTDLPQDSTSTDVDRSDVSDAVGRVDQAIVVSDAAAIKRRRIVPFVIRRLAGPKQSSILPIEGAHGTQCVDRIDAAIGDDWCRREASCQVASATGLRLERAPKGPKRELAHRLLRIAARLAPFRIRLRRR